MSPFFKGPQSWMQYFRWGLNTVEQIHSLILYIDAEWLLAGFFWLVCFFLLDLPICAAEVRLFGKKGPTKIYLRSILIATLVNNFLKL